MKQSKQGLFRNGSEVMDELTRLGCREAQLLREVEAGRGTPAIEAELCQLEAAIDETFELADQLGYFQSSAARVMREIRRDGAGRPPGERGQAVS